MRKQHPLRRALLHAAGLVLALVAAERIEADLIVNGGFETFEETFGEPGFPTEYGDWKGDTSEIVTSQNGITPFEGSRMLHFIDTFPGSPGGFDKSDVYQLVDISQYADLIADEALTLRATARFNRTAGDLDTDTRFDIKMEAQAGEPSDFPSSFELDEAMTSIFTDADPATWEILTLEFVPPADTDFLALKVRSVEDIWNDLEAPEFDGHFADAVTLTIWPEPTDAIVLQAGDADQDLDFDQLDLVQVQVAAKYLTGQPATWGEGDWNGAPGGELGDPPLGDGVFDQRDIMAALISGKYLTGRYAALHPRGQREQFLLDDLTVVGSLSGGGALGDVNLAYVPVPEPTSLALFVLGMMFAVMLRGYLSLSYGGD